MSEETKKTCKSCKSHGEISRRQFLIDTGLVAGGAALGATALLSSCTPEPVTETVTTTKTVNATVTSPPVTTTVMATAAPKPISLEVYEPTGNSAAQVKVLYAKRLDTLEGKTIAMMA